MKKKEGKFLPIGTIVTTENSIRPLMIMGFFGKDKNNKIYDYITSISPEGIITPNELYLINHEDIKQVLGLGYLHQLHTFFEEKHLKGMEYENNKS